MLKGAIVGCGGVTHVSHLPIFQALKDVKIDLVRAITAKYTDFPWVIEESRETTRILEEIWKQINGWTSPSQGEIGGKGP